MDVNDLKGLYAEVNKRMNATLDHLKHELAGVRTGRATTGILDPVQVEAYGSRMPLNQLANLSIPEPTTKSWATTTRAPSIDRRRYLGSHRHSVRRARGGDVARIARKGNRRPRFRSDRLRNETHRLSPTG